MTPRRPSPARPGIRPGSRRSGSRARAGVAPTTRDTAGTGSLKAEQSAAHAPISHEEPPQFATAKPATPEQARVRRHEHMMLRLGGSDGLGIPVRLIILLVVILFSFVIVFPALRGYLAQQAQYDEITGKLAEAKATSTALESELAKWKDDDYVRAQARQRLFYVMPGETAYVVVGADQFEQQATELAKLSSSTETKPWYQVLRDSAQIAGDTGEKKESRESSRQGWATATPTDSASTQPTPAASSTP